MNPSQFEMLVPAILAALPQGMGFSLYGSGEESDFVRFNHGKVRQSGSVSQGEVSLSLIDGKRHASVDIGLSGVASVDAERITAAVANLAQTVPLLPEDPHLLLPDTVVDTNQIDDTPAPDATWVTQSVCRATKGTDFVGIYAGGRQWRAFANDMGQRNWFESSSFLLDYSIVHSKDKAIKSSLGGTIWSDEALVQSIEEAKAQLTALNQPSRTIPPGSYRAYLTPAAVVEVLELMSYGGFSAESQQRKSSVLNRLVAGDAQLDARVTLTEDGGRGLGPKFSADGFVAPDQVVLVSKGKHANALTSPRTAVEFDIPHNGATPGEYTQSLTMAGGDLPQAEALARLGTGVWVSNLWYLNHSDRNAARFTGMTRFATFWVEDGKLVAPLDVMRFDATLYDLFGKDLEALTQEVQLMPSASTYEARSTAFLEVPGALVKALPFTL